MSKCLPALLAIGACQSVLVAGDSLTANGTIPYTLAQVLDDRWLTTGTQVSFVDTRHEAHSGKGYIWFHSDPTSPMFDTSVYRDALPHPASDVVFFLGINDLFSKSAVPDHTDASARIQEMLSAADDLDASIKSAMPWVTIRHCTLPQPNSRASAFTDNYGPTGRTRDEWLAILAQANPAIVAHWPDAIRLDLDGVIDTTADYPETNALHMLASGSVKLAGAIADAIR